MEVGSGHETVDRVGLGENLMIGIVTGIPVNRAQEGLSSFIRIIYEPGFKTFH